MYGYIDGWMDRWIDNCPIMVLQGSIVALPLHSFYLFLSWARVIISVEI